MRRAFPEITSARVSAAICLSVLATAVAGAQTPPANPVGSDGSVQLPRGAPPTRLERAVPPPKMSIPPVEKPLRVSITAQQLDKLVRDKTLTIDDAVGIALAANRDYATAIAALQRARGMLNEAKAALVPQVGIAGQIEEYTQNTTIDFVGESILQVNQFNPVYTAQVTLPLDLFGSIRSAVSQAQFNDVAARIDVNRARNVLVFNVRDAFFQALRAQGAYSVAVESLDNAQTRLSDAQKGLSAGLSSRFDVITVERDVADAQQNVVNARAQVTLALGQLKSTIGIDVSVPIKVTDAGAVETPPGIVPIVIPPPDHSAIGSTTPLPQPSAPLAQIQPAAMPALPDTHIVQDLTDLGPEYRQAVDEALKTRPEILESDAQISAAQKGIQYAKRSQLPSFGLQLQYIYQPDATIFVPQHQAVATLSLNIPIFDGGVAAAREQQAKADASSAVTARRSAVDQVTLDVQQAYVAIAEARDRVQVTEAEVAQAREAYRLSRVRFMAGVSQTPTVSPQLELSNAEVSLTVAETNRLNALYDYNVARCQLDRAIGRYSYGAGLGYSNPPGPGITGTGR
jgi:outer membrane protein